MPPLNLPPTLIPKKIHTCGLCRRLSLRSQNFEKMERILINCPKQGLSKQTGLPDREMFVYVCNEVRKQSMIGGNWGMILINIDNFRKINSRYGMKIGDIILKNYGQILLQIFKETTPRETQLFHLRSDIFAALTTTQSDSDLLQLANLVRKEMCMQEIETSKSPEDFVKLRFSAGVACPEKKQTYSSWYSSAETALKNAKKAGGDQVKRPVKTTKRSSKWVCSTLTEFFSIWFPF